MGEGDEGKPAPARPPEDAKAEGSGGPIPTDGEKPPVVPKPKPKKTRKPDVLSPSTRRLIRDVGVHKLGPDLTAVERHYNRSLAIRTLVFQFLHEHRDTVWADPSELHAQAANAAGCSMPTAARWVFQFTRADAPFKLHLNVDRWVLERRDG